MSKGSRTEVKIGTRKAIHILKQSVSRAKDFIHSFHCTKIKVIKVNVLIFFRHTKTYVLKTVCDRKLLSFLSELLSEIKQEISGLSLMILVARLCILCHSKRTVVLSPSPLVLDTYNIIFSSS